MSLIDTTQKSRSQSLITTYFGRNHQLDADSETLASEHFETEQNIIDETEIDLLHLQMQICMDELNAAVLSDEAVELFFDKIEVLQSRINAVHTSNATIEPTVEIKTNLNSFMDLSSLPIYYNNVRCITNKRNIGMRIGQSMYKILCFTETWLSNKQCSNDYFPSGFEVYRCDRALSSQQFATRRAGGVAVIVHTEQTSRPGS